MLFLRRLLSNTGHQLLGSAKVLPCAPRFVNSSFRSFSTSDEVEFEQKKAKPKRKRRRQSRGPPVLLTEAALQRMKEIVEMSDTDLPGVRIGVKTQGCSGISYTMNHSDSQTVTERDEVLQAEGFSVYIDPKALLYIIGTTVDFVEDELGSEFKFKNPNATGMCGCGESFSVGPPA